MTGIELDLELGLRLEAALGRIEQTLDRNGRRSAPPPAAPVFYPFGDVAVVAGTTAIVCLGGPDQGMFWYVRSITVGGADPSTTPGGAADIYISAMDLRAFGTATPTLMDWRDRASTLPNIAFYGAGEMVLRAGEKLYAKFTGATNGVILSAACRAEVNQERAGTLAWVT